MEKGGKEREAGVFFKLMYIICVFMFFSVIYFYYSTLCMYLVFWAFFTSSSEREIRRSEFFF